MFVINFHVIRRNFCLGSVLADGDVCGKRYSGQHGENSQALLRRGDLWD